MKPSNLLLNSDCLMKVADFGLARSMPEARSLFSMGVEPDEPPTPLTDYVATRWYRAPEILLGSEKYGFAVDMWAVGCILGEMLIGKPMFPGTSTMNQIEKITELVGCPARERVKSISRFSETMLYVSSQQKYPPPHSGRPFTPDDAYLTEEQAARDDRAAIDRFKRIFDSASDDAIDLLIHLLHFDPNKRITAQQALQHPYIAQFHDPAVERSATKPVKPIISDDEKKSTNFYREKLYNQINQSAQHAAAEQRGSRAGGQDSRRGPASGR